VALQNIAAPNLDVRQRHGRRIAANVGIGFIAGGEKEIEAEAQDGDSGQAHDGAVRSEARDTKPACIPLRAS